ncbi:MAG: ATP-binding protein [Planctomycetota bacterium]
MTPRQTFALSFRTAILVFLIMLAVREGAPEGVLGGVAPLATYAPSLLLLLTVLFVVEARDALRPWAGISWALVFASASLALIASSLIHQPSELTFFLFGFSVATARDGWGGVLIGLMGCGGYLVMAHYGVWAVPLGDPQILARAGVLLATPLFTGHLSRLADQEREERAEQTAELREELGTLGHHLRLVLDSVSSGVLVIETLSGTVTTYNRAAERILGVAAHRVLGRKATTIEDLASFLAAVLPRVEASGGEVERADFSFTRPDGRELQVGFGVSPLEDLAGRRLGWIVVFQDVTLIRDYEARMTRQEQLAAVGRLVSGIAHEFGNLLGGARGHAELALTGDAEEKDEALEVIRTSLTRALDTVENLLRFARGTPIHAVEDVDLSGVVEQALLLLKPTLASSPVEVECKVEPVSVCADAAQIEQVVVNLLINAVHACQDRPNPRVQVSLAPVVGGGALLRVEDNGPGVPVEERKRIFQPFFTTKGALGGSATPGTGLGLSTSLGVVHGHGGSLDVDESPSLGGARFSLRLPSTMSDPTQG